MSYKAAIFDLDGTLLDTLDDLADCCNRALAAHDFAVHPREAYKYFVGDGVHMLISRVLGGNNTPENKERVLAAYSADYAAHSQVKTAPYDGILPLLAGLKSKNIKLAVLSNKPHAMTKQVVGHYFPQLFDVIVGQRDGIRHKPAPDGALDIIAGWGLEKTDILYIGDTGVDMQTAKGAGLFALGALWGFRPASELVQFGADLLAETPMDALKLFSEAE